MGQIVAAKIILPGDELWINKKYRNTQVDIGCIVKGINTSYVNISSLVVALVDDENEKTEVRDWKTLEKWLVVKYKESENVDIDMDKIKFDASSKVINLVRNKKVLGSIYSLVKFHNDNI